ncbi:MAG: ABC transporter substrate-binding protein [Thermomicrobiales bacterium]
MSSSHQSEISISGRTATLTLPQGEPGTQQGRLTRRNLLQIGARLGLAAPAVAALAGVAGASAAPQAATQRNAAFRQEGAQRFTFVRDDSIPDLDPYWYYNEGAGGIHLATYENLIQYAGESTSEFAPALAERWETNADGTVYTFTLHDGILFHDGDPLTAQSVKDAYARCIGLGQSISNVLTRFIPTVDQIEVLDDRTLAINLERPQPLLLSALAGAFGTWVVNPRYVQENATEDDPWAHDFYATNIVGSGPFLLSEYSPNERIVLERFADYRDGWDADQFSEIVLRFVPEITVRQQLIEQGDIDATTHNLSPESLETLKANPDLKVEIYDSTLASWVAMNATKLSRDARIAFSYAFPYDDVVNGAYKGLIKRSGPVPTTVRGYDPDIFLYQTDLARAKELLQAAGINEGDSFEYVLESGNAVEDVVAQLFQANLQSIGITLEILSIDPSTVSDMIYSEADPETLPHFFGGRGWWPDYNDPYNQLYPSFVEASIGGGNASRWVNPRFEELMAQAAVYTEEEELVSIMKEAQNILTEQDPPAIYYGQQLWYTVLRKDIEGFGWNPLYLSSYHPLRSLKRTAA